MTLQEESRLSYYQKIADISEHRKVSLVQHRETRQIYVRKELSVYDRSVYQFLLEHPNRYFPCIYECIEKDGSLILIEEYIQGQSLEACLEENGLFTEEETADVIGEVCEALKLLHNQPTPMIHRDLKPSNILRDKDGQIKLVDFDAARNFDDSKDNDTVIMGTRRYAAPEQYGYIQTDARTDIYALGVTMNRLLTDHYPSEKIYDGKLNSVIRTCLCFDPAERYQTVSDLQQALRDAMSSARAKKENVRHPHLPPGFRTLTWWKMLVAVLGYAFVLEIGLTLDVPDAAESGFPVADLWLNRICETSIGILWIFFWFNYLDVHRVLPFMKKKRWKWIGYLLYSALIALVILVLFVLLETALQG